MSYLFRQAWCPTFSGKPGGVLPFPASLVSYFFRQAWCPTFSGKPGLLPFPASLVSYFFRQAWFPTFSGKPVVLPFPASLVSSFFRQAWWCPIFSGKPGVLLFPESLVSYFSHHQSQELTLPPVFIISMLDILIGNYLNNMQLTRFQILKVHHRYKRNIAYLDKFHSFISSYIIKMIEKYIL